MNRCLVIGLLLLVHLIPLKSQEVAVKSNLLYDAVTAINVGVETPLSPQWTVDVSGGLKAWDLKSDSRWRHYYIQPEVRYYLCDIFSGHFFGAHLLGGQYNVGSTKSGIPLSFTDFSQLSTTRTQGWYLGAGVAYGYSWILNEHWNIEAELGYGYAYTRYDRYPCATCGDKLEENMPHHYVGPTKAAVSLIYLF